MRYTGKVLTDSGRDFLSITSEVGYAPLVTVAVQIDAVRTELYLSVSEARELAQHLLQAVEAIP